MSSSGELEAFASFSFGNFVRRLLLDPNEAWALARAPKDMLLMEDCTSSSLWSSSDPGSPSSWSDSSPKGLDWKKKVR
jgi:hypothetical protein